MLVLAKLNFGSFFPDENGLLDYDGHRRNRIYLRRLSGSGISAAAAEVFLRNQVQAQLVDSGPLPPDIVALATLAAA